MVGPPDKEKAPESVGALLKGQAESIDERVSFGNGATPRRWVNGFPPDTREGDAAATAGARPPGVHGAALVSSAYGQKIPREAFRAEVFPSGLRVVRQGVANIVPPKGYVRGEIQGFSPEASRRLKEFCMTQCVCERVVWAFTFTVRRDISATDWRSALKRFRMALKYQGWAGVWRVELQRRGVPHIHAAMWLPEDVGWKAVRDLWLSATRQEDDREARRHAVLGKPIPAAKEAGWTVYQALHNGKHKESQLGWRGKQWGVWGRDMFTPRAPLEVRELRPEEEVQFRRFLGRFMRSKGSRAFIGRAGFTRMMDTRPTVLRWLACWDEGLIAPASRAVVDMKAKPAATYDAGAQIVYRGELVHERLPAWYCRYAWLMRETGVWGESPQLGA